MTFSMALAKTIILILQWSNFSNSCHVTALNRECFPKRGKIHMVLQGNKGGKCIFITQKHYFSLYQLRPLCTSQKLLFSGLNRVVGS